jgi:hypothetical protein
VSSPKKKEPRSDLLVVVKELSQQFVSGAQLKNCSPEIQKLPITFRLPRAGQRDPHFGLSRAWFYAAEGDGRINLIRLREKGKKRGTTLVLTEQVLNLITSEKEKQ